MKRILAVLILAALIAAPVLAKDYSIEKVSSEDIYEIIRYGDAIRADNGETISVVVGVERKAYAKLEAEIVDKRAKLAVVQAELDALLARQAEFDAVLAPVIEKEVVEEPVIEIPDILKEDYSVNWVDTDILIN